MVVDPTGRRWSMPSRAPAPSEESRIDFGAFNALGRSDGDALIAELEEAAAASDVVILNQQIPAGVSGAGRDRADQ